jgi:hypothetical protein
MCEIVRRFVGLISVAVVSLVVLLASIFVFCCDSSFLTRF